MKWSSLIPWGRKSSALSTSDILGELLARASSKTGIAVNWQTALQASTALACARVIAEGIAQVPFKLYRERPGGGMDPAKDHHLYELLSLKPNSWQTSYDFREQMGLHLAFAGNFYAYKVRGLRNKIVELLPFEPQLVTLKRDGWDRSYDVYTGKGRVMNVPAADMWHVRGLSWDGMAGLDGIKLAREAIGLSLATEEHGSRLFSNGARAGGIISSDATKPTDDAMKHLRDSWNEMQGGNANAFKTAFLFGGLKYQSLAQNGVDSQHLEQRRFQVEEVCRGFRVMPIMVGHSDKAATYASSEQMFLAHVVHTLAPRYFKIEQSAAIELLSEKERAEGLYFAFIVQGLMRGASKDRAEYYSKALGSGGSPAWLTQDEVRALEEFNPMGGVAAALPIATNVSKGTENANPAP
jgi:HK97 family phage portal protein